MQTYIPFHAPALFDRAELAAKSAQGVVCVILCAATAEAFLHDLTEWYKMSIEHKKSCPNKQEQKNIFSKTTRQFCFSELHNFTDIEEAIYNELTLLESTHACVLKKYDVIRKIVHGDTWKKGEQPYQNLFNLLKIRNAIVHIKGETLSADGSYECDMHTSLINGYPKFLDNFKKHGMLKNFESFRSWIELIETVEFSKWCLESVNAMVVATQKTLPNAPISARFKHASRLSY